MRKATLQLVNIVIQILKIATCRRSIKKYVGIFPVPTLTRLSNFLCFGIYQRSRRYAPMEQFIDGFSNII